MKRSLSVRSVQFISTALILLLFPIVATSIESIVKTTLISNTFISSYLKYIMILLTSFSFGESISVIYCYKMHVQKKEELNRIFNNLPAGVIAFYPVVALSVIGSFFMMFKGAEGNIMTGIILVFVGFISGFSLNVELRTSLLQVNKNRKENKKEQKSISVIILIYLILSITVYLPILWLIETSVLSNTMKTEINIISLISLGFAGYIIKKYIPKTSEINNQGKSMHSIMIIVILNILGNIGFLFWDFNTAILINEAHYSMISKTLILIFLGYFPIRLVTVLLSEEKWIPITINIVMLTVYFILKLMNT